MTQILTLLLTTMAGSLPGSVQNQEKQQQQASTRQLTASDFAQNPDAFIARMANMLGLPGANNKAAGGGVGGISGALQSLIQKFTQGNSQNLSNNVFQGEQAQLASSGLGQAPGIANEEMATALAPLQISEQQLGAQEGVGAVNTALQNEQSNLQYPFQIGAQGAGSFPSFATL
jgi:hypothetical protein